MAKYNNVLVTKEFLDKNPDVVFVFGDNTKRVGSGGAAILRYHPQAYGFVTKINPDHYPHSFYTPETYAEVFETELFKLELVMMNAPNKTFYISQLGGGLANRHKIWEKIIKDGLEKALTKYENVVFLWNDEQTTCRFV